MKQDVLGLSSVLTPCQTVINYPRNIQLEWLSQRYCVFTLTSPNSGITYLAATHPDLEKVQFIDFSYRYEDIEQVYHSLAWAETVVTDANQSTFVYKTAPSVSDIEYFLLKYRPI